MLSDTSSGYVGCKRHLSILDKDTMDELACLSIPSMGDGWNVMCIANGSVYLPHQQAAIGRVDIAKVKKCREEQTAEFGREVTLNQGALIMDSSRSMEDAFKTMTHDAEVKNPHSLIECIKPGFLSSRRIIKLEAMGENGSIAVVSVDEDDDEVTTAKTEVVLLHFLSSLFKSRNFIG